MDCKSVMAPIKKALYADELAGVAIDFMVEKHMGLVPVTNRDGTFAGLISGSCLMAMMLPRTLSAISGSFHNTSFLNENASEMEERFSVLRERTVGEMLDSQVQVAHPETPLIDPLMMIKDQQNVVPVVDEQNVLLGAISFFSVLYGLNKEVDREQVERMKAAERRERETEKEQH